MHTYIYTNIHTYTYIHAYIYYNTEKYVLYLLFRCLRVKCHKGYSPLVACNLQFLNKVFGKFLDHAEPGGADAAGIIKNQAKIPLFTTLRY